MAVNEQRIAKKHVIDDLLQGGDARRRAIDCLLEGLEAERSFYDAGSKSTLTEPDYKTRVTAAEILLAYTDGKPIERKEIVKMTMDSMESYTERIKRSPELRAKLRELLGDAEKPVVDLKGKTQHTSA